MSLPMPALYHWSPSTTRAKIKRYGLKPTTPTATPIGPPMPGGARLYDPEGTTFAVCLGTSPSHAWALSGNLFGTKGDWWDLYQVILDEGDEVHPLPFTGYRFHEVRVANRIPKSRVWYVGSRVR